MSEPGQVTSLASHSNHETVSKTNHPLNNLPSKAHQPRKKFPKKSLDSLQKVLVAIVQQMALAVSLEKWRLHDLH